MKRRDFFNWVGLGLLTSSLPVAIAACRSSEMASEPDASEESTEGDATPREDGFAVVGTVSELDEAGFLSDSDFQGTQVVVIRNPADTSAVLAVDSLCTHQGCTVDWDSEAGVLACPCHGSKFNPDGGVVEGPATAPLGSFEAKIEEDWVLVKVS